MHTNFTAAHCAPYYRELFVANLRRVLPTPQAVAQALEAVEVAEFITQLPTPEIAEPFLKLLLAGARCHTELLLFNLEAARRHRMEWGAYVEEYLLPYVLAGLPLPGAPARAGLVPYRPDVHTLAVRVVDRNPAGPMSMVYSSLDARTHEELTRLYNSDVPRDLPGASWASLLRSDTVELSYGVLPRRLFLGSQVLTDDFLETAQVA